MRKARLLCALVVIGCFSHRTAAQVPDPNAAAQSPVPGVGHQYIGIGAETVNPADGSLSFDLPLQPPPGRNLSFPFGIHYSSTERFSPSGTGPSVLWVKFLAPPFQLNGWNYQLPVYTAQVYKSFWGLNPQQQSLYCDHTQNYVFRGFDGVQRNISLQAQWPDGGANQFNCTASTSLNSAVYGFASASPSNYSGWPTHPTITVSDPSGTSYVFPADPLAPSGTPTPWGLFATTVTDRNGNQITYTGSSPSGPGGSYRDTLGRTVVSWTGIGSGTGDQLTISGLSGNVTVHWETVTESFPEAGHDVADNGVAGPCSMTVNQTSPQSISAVSEIDLPNGTKYSFLYQSVYARPSKIFFPGGGYVRYVWGLNSSSDVSFEQWPVSGGGTATCSLVHDTGAISDRYVSYDGSTEVLHQQFTYSTTYGSDPAVWTQKTTNVTSTDLLTGQITVTKYTYASGSAVGSAQVPVEQTILYQDGSAHTLRTTKKIWLDAVRLSGEQNILDNGQGNATLRCFDSNAQLTDLYEYGFQAEGAKPADPTCVSSTGLTVSAIGPLRRHTAMVYHNFVGATPSTHIVNAADNVTVFDGLGTQIKQTSFLYDGSSVTSSGTATGLVSVATLRGNPTSVTRWLSTGSPVTKYAYFDNGQILSETDPCGSATCTDMSGTAHTTTYSYTDSNTSCGGTAPPAGNTNAYLTKITNPLGQIQSFCYGYNDGQLRGATDANSKTTTYKYGTTPSGCTADQLDRLGEVDYPDGGKTTYCYNDSTFNAATPSPSVTTSSAITSTTNVLNLVAVDGLGHTARIQLESDPDCATGLRTDTTYDGFGRTRTVSNPYCSTGDSTYGLTTFVYDALGRVTQTTRPDNNTELTTYTGRATQVQDEGNGAQRVTRVSQIDGLGRLASVCEVSGTTLLGITPTPAACGEDIAATGFLTSYQYDSLDNLKQVTQGGLNARSFTYDSLSRLGTATNPESGQTIYTYDVDSNLQTKKDARNITITYAYDVLNRLTGKSYSDATPAVTYAYDQTIARGVSLTNTIGRRSSESTAGTSPSGAIFSYDSMGRVVDNSQCTPQNCSTGVFAFQYTQHDLQGNVSSATNAAGITFTYTYSTANRVTNLSTNFVDGSHPGTLFSGAHYGAFGLTSDNLGSAIAETMAYTKRGWLQAFSASAGANSRYSFSVGTFAPNGDIKAANDSANGNWTYGYDPFNRLVSASATGQSYTYDYDRFGNRWHQNGPHSSSLGFDANNHVVTGSGVTYDATGNVTADGSHTYAYDAEERISKVDGGTTATYVYDAEGRRVRKTTASGSVDYLYDLDGNQVAEVGPSAVFNRGEVYLGSRHLATYSAGPTGAAYFMHRDWLGTERLRTDFTGLSCETITSLPFGDAQTTSGTCGDVSPMHFTGKQRDSESGLDDFGDRYYSSPTGRFTSVDPIWVKNDRLSDPQRLNLYAYGRNNPLLFTDPDGRDVTIGRCSIGSAQDCFNQLQAGLNKDDREHVKLVTGDGKNGCEKGVSCVTVDADYKSDSKNFQVLQTLANDHSATATLDVLKPNEKFDLKTTISINVKTRQEKLGIMSTTPAFDGYTFFPYKKGDPGPFSPDDITHSVINSEPSDADIPATIHHEMRHIFLGDFGRSAKKAGHGQPGVDQQTKAAEDEAKKNEKPN
jgi:RHS repeat-associated protein